MTIEEQFKLKYKFDNLEAVQLIQYLSVCHGELSDEGLECFVKRDMGKFIHKLMKRRPSDTSKDFTMTMGWYEFQSIKYAYNTFAHESIFSAFPLVSPLIGKLDQLLPAGFSFSVSH